MALELEVDNFRNKLANWKKTSKILKYGVSAKSLRADERRQQMIMEELKEFNHLKKSKDPRSSQTNAQFNEIKNEINNNISSLQYLAGISNMENLYSELTENIGAHVLHNSVIQNISEEMLSNMHLSENVEECWNYITKLASISQVHLRNASHYHQFYHDMNEVLALLNRRRKILSDQVASYEANGTIKESERLSTNLKDHSSYYLYLWDRITNLKQESQKIVPFNLRLDPVRDESLFGQCLCSYSGPDISIQDREEVTILNNSDPKRWKVKNSKGEIGDVPSVLIWIPGPDVGSENKIKSIQTQLIKNWEQCLNRFSIVLIDHYINLFDRMLSEQTISVTKIEHLNDFIKNIQRILLSNSTNIKSNELENFVREVRKRVVITKSEEFRSTQIYRESEIIKMHTPLLKYVDHLKILQKLRDSSQFINDGNRYRDELPSRDSRDKCYTSNLETLNKLHEKNQTELNRLVQSMEQIPHENLSSRKCIEYNRQFSSSSDLKHDHSYHLHQNLMNSNGKSYIDHDDRKRNVRSPSLSSSISDIHQQNFTKIQCSSNQNTDFVDHVHLSHSLPRESTVGIPEKVKSSHRPGRKKVWKLDAQTQLGVTVRDSKIQCSPLMYNASTSIQDDIFSTIGSSITSSRQKPKLKQKEVFQLDAQTQIGVLFKDSSTQDDRKQFGVSGTKGESRSRSKKHRLLIDSMTQIGCFVESRSTQVNLDEKEISSNVLSGKTPQMDAMTQISILVNDRISQTQTSGTRSIPVKLDCQTQIGTLISEANSQTVVNNKSRGIQTTCLQLDVITQMSLITRESDTQTDSMNYQHSDQLKTVIYLQDNSTDIPSLTPVKSKRLQTGPPRLTTDGEVSIQTDNEFMDQQLQTAEELSDGQILPTVNHLQHTVLHKENVQLVDAEIQSDLPYLHHKEKNIQCGYSKLGDLSESSCQIGIRSQEIQIQTDTDETENLLEITVTNNEQSGREEQELTDNSTQCEESKEIDKKNRKVQVGNSKLGNIFDVICQARIIFNESSSQTDELSATAMVNQQYKQSDENVEYCNQETQYDVGKSHMMKKGKKVQAGYPRLNITFDVESQSVHTTSDIGIGTMENVIVTEKVKLLQEKMVLEEIQFNMSPRDKGDHKNKKVQVGSAKLESDMDVSFQTGHLISTNETQTDNDFRDYEELDLVDMKEKEFTEKEVQFETSDKMETQLKGKKVQVGFPQINSHMDVACQLGYAINDENTQTDTYEMNFFEESVNKDVTDGITESMSKKSQILQVGSSKLLGTYDVACQSSLILNHTETQTSSDYTDYIGNIDSSENQLMLISKSKNKKIQVGLPKLNTLLETECQIDVTACDISLQTDADDFIVKQKNISKQETAPMMNEMTDETVQFNTVESRSPLH